MDNHTPGPWHTCRAHTSDAVGITHDIGAALIADAYGEQRHANAALITTAPDGLALANLVVEYFGEDEIPASLDSDIALRDAARALIAKAEADAA
ncbi:MAG: hypothetical protein AB7S70_02485 [Hyphomicrobium sp.]|uniref:hypothetical protein n=1 Tax=Hyphomicrobium sp. TaxID=82 RepID=UPI003D139D9C